MRKIILRFLILLLIVAFGNVTNVMGQERIIEPNEGYVNEIIKADTASDGSQMHTTYIFRRGETYWVNNDIQNVGYPITLKSEDGNGALPTLRAYPNASGDLRRILEAKDDAYIYNLYLDGMGPDINDATLPYDPTYVMYGQLLRAAAAGKVLVIDGCVLNNTGQTIIRSNSGARKVEVTNTIIANSGQLCRDNIGNGRIIDFRNGKTDSVVFRNCTMVNSLDRIVRHYGAAANTVDAAIEYFEFDHNTVVHNAGAYGFMFLGDISGTVKITNNLFYNPMTLGVDLADEQRFAEVMNITDEVDGNGNLIYPLIIEQPNTLFNPTYVMRNNVITYDQTVKEYMAKYNIEPAPALAPRLAAQVADENPFVDADIALTNIPDVMIEIMEWYHPLAVAESAGGMITTSDVDMNRMTPEYWMNDLDCSYSTSNAAFMGSDGKPVGAEWGSNVVEWNERIIEPNEGYVNEIIKADTAADGSQIHNSYVFRRGETYWVNSDIQNVGYPITLKSEDGNGALPTLRAYPNASGDLRRILEAKDDAYIYNLYLDGMGPDINDAALPYDPTYVMYGQLLRAAAAGKVLVIDGCVLNNTGQTIIRSNSGARKVEVTNTIIANSGQLCRDNIGNGRIIDFRNGKTDIVIFRNCTMVNSLDRIVRHYGAAANTVDAAIEYFEFDHNTVVHNAGAYGFMFLGDISGTVKITNNLFYNPMTLGVDLADEQRFAEVMNITDEVDGNGNLIYPLIIEQPNTLFNPTYVMRNNVITYDQTVKEYMAKYNIEPAPALAPRLAAQVADENPFVDADIALTNIPDVMIEIMEWYHPLAVAESAGGMITTSDVDMNRMTPEYWMNDLDCSYSTSNAAFMGSDGKPVGAEWNSTVTDIEEDGSDIVPTTYSLSNNYPNPFNPSTNITFSLPENSKVTLTIYNILGQEIVKLVDTEMSAGSHTVKFDASRLSSGIYVYAMKANSKSGASYIATHKMALLK